MLYDGPSLGTGPVKLVAPDPRRVQEAETGESDEVGPWSRWFDAARSDDTIMHFGIELGNELAGEIFLHDVDFAGRSGMVGYRVYEASRRARGVGVAALSNLVEWVRRQRHLDRLCVIARSTITASCRLAERCGFELAGTAREDPGRSVYELALTTP